MNGYNPSIDTGNHEEVTYLKHKRQQLSTFRKVLAGYNKKDVAHAAQKCLEETVSAHVRATVKETGIRNLVLAGGVFANVKLNQRIRELECVDGIYIYPAMNDSGLSVGAALWEHHINQKHPFKPATPSSVCIGLSLFECRLRKTPL